MAQTEPKFDAHIRADAAAWLSRVRSENATPEDLASFQSWLQESDRHQNAFAAVNETWELVGSLPLSAYAFGREDNSLGPSVVARRSVLATGIVGAVAAVWGFGVKPQFYGTSYVTAVGEQRRVPLMDGSMLLLDTNTSVRVAFAEHARNLYLLRGRAFFEVAHDVTRPFVVQAGQREVVALGTAFDVTLANADTEILLVKGRIAVRLGEGAPAAPVEMNDAGDFLKVAADGTVNRDHVALGEATAWQEGRIIFDNEPLRLAVDKMNRYTRRPLVLDDPAIGKLRISGIYRAGDVEAFAESLSALLPVVARFEPTHVILDSAARVSD